MKILKGFTLAEVLITLGVIGVIAAMTLPALNTNIQQAQVGPSILKAMNSLQNSLSLGMAQKEIRKLTAPLFADAKSVFEDTNGPLYTTLDFYDADNNTRNYSNYDGSPNEELSKGSRRYTTKDGIEFRLPNYGDNSTVEITGMKTHGHGGFKVYVDINGKKAPNTLGKDMFLFIVDVNGIVIPYGGYEYARYSEDSETPLWESTCNNVEITSGEACTGSIIDNAGKVKYAWGR